MGVKSSLTFALRFALPPVLHRPVWYNDGEEEMGVRDVHQARLLIVDDEPELRRMLLSILRGDGYADIHEAATAAEAMEKALHFRPDAVILDVMLPDGDGFSLLKELRTFTQAPVLFLRRATRTRRACAGWGLARTTTSPSPFCQGS